MVLLRADHPRHRLQYQARRHGCLCIHKRSRLLVPQALHPSAMLPTQGLVPAPLCSLALLAAVPVKAAAGAGQRPVGALAAGAALIAHAGIVARIALECLVHACWDSGWTVSALCCMPERHEDDALPHSLHPEGNNVPLGPKVRVVHL